jgi:ankyrin repeat protein
MCKKVLSDPRASERASERELLTLLCAWTCCSVAALLNKRPAIDINAIDWMGNTPVIAAAKSGCLEAIDLLLECDELDLNITAADRTGIVHCLIILWAGQSEKTTNAFTTERLIQALTKMKQCGAQMGMHGKLNATPLHQAIFVGNREVVKWLVENNASVNALNQYEPMPCHVMPCHAQPKPCHCHACINLKSSNCIQYGRYTASLCRSNK